MTKRTFVSEDIKNLFVSFGGNPEHYEEPTIAQKPVNQPAKNVRKTPAKVKPSPTTAQSAPKTNGIFKPKPVQQNSGLFKPRKDQEVELAEPASQQVQVNDDDYLLRLAGSPWLTKRLMREGLVVQPLPDSPLSKASVSEANDAHFDGQQFYFSQNQANEQDEVVALQPVAEMSRVKSASRVQIFVEPKPITEALKQNIINSVTADSVRKSSN